MYDGPLRSVFDLIDADGSGSINRSEFLRAVRSQSKISAVVKACPRLKPLLKPSVYAEVFLATDEDRDGSLSSDEFRSFALDMCNHVDAAERCLLRLFTAADRNQQGYVECEAMHAALLADETPRAKEDTSKTEAHDDNSSLPLAVKTMLSPWGVGLSFLVLDTDLDGHLTVAELQSSGVQIAMKLLLLERELRRVFDLLDLSKTGVISKTDVLKALRTDGNVLKHIKLVEALRPLAAPRRFEDAFTKMDTDKDGHVTWVEFHQFAVVTTMRAYAVREGVNRLFALVDTDKNGTLEKQELLRAIQKDERVRTVLKYVDALRPLLKPTTFAASFLSMDTDQDGHVAPRELESYCIEKLKMATIMPMQDGAAQAAAEDATELEQSLRSVF